MPSRPAYTPWHKVRRVRIEPLRPSRARVQFRRAVPWRVLETFPLDVEVCCTPGQAAALRERVAGWRAGTA